MPAILTNHATRRCIAQSEISKMLADAATRHAGLVVRVHADTLQRKMPGSFLAHDESEMVVKLSNDAPPSPLTARSVFSVVWWVDGIQYACETTYLGGHDGDKNHGNEHVIRFAIPSHIDIMERRRASRRLLQERSLVHLRPVDDSVQGAAYLQPRTAVMLNVSPHGLACRLDTSRIEGLSVGANLTATFTVEPNDPPLVFPARIVSITSGGTPGQAIVGIEFIDDGNSHAREESLVAALARNADA